VPRSAGSGRLKSVFLQSANILNSMFKYLVGNCETFELLTKSCTKFDSLFVNINNMQLHVHLKK